MADPLNFADPYGLWSIFGPQGPSIWDHFRGGRNEYDNTKWFEKNYKGWVDFAKKDLNSRLNDKIKKSCGKPNGLSFGDLNWDITPKYDRYSVDKKQNETKHGDKPQSRISSAVILGAFYFQVQDVTISYSTNPETNLLTYEYTASVVVLDAPGTEPGDAAYDWSLGIGGGIAPKRQVIRARWKIKGNGEECP